jgi:hypothetical protein
VAQKSPARLFVLLAREKPEAVIFRRGPSKQVLLIKWNLRDDTFEPGQWFKGRIYERRCDLSPDGKFLIYFAAKQKPPMYSWTAISKPPFFTALALWQKGDCWNGGGWFLDNKAIRLNHGVGSELHRGFRSGPIRIAGFAESGGEDDTVWDIVRKRDGWVCESDGHYNDRGGTRGWDVDPPQKWTKTGRRGNVLEQSIVGIGGKDAWYQIEYRVWKQDQAIFDIGRADWADWDHKGNLLFAKDGCLFRQYLTALRRPAPKKLADFNHLKFENVTAPAWAQRW